MKRKTVLLTIIVLMSFHLFTIRAEGPVIKETIRELTPKFTYDIGKIINSRVPVRYMLLNRNDRVSITDEDDDYYFIDNGYLILAVDRSFIRRDDEKPFEQHTGYTRSGAAMYSDYDLKEKLRRSFKLNDNVEVIDAFYGVLLVQDEDGNLGYMSPSSVSNKKIVVYHPQPAATTEETPAPSSGGSSHSSGGGGGSSSGGSSPAPAPAPSPDPAPSTGDGEDISLAFHFDLYETSYLEEGESPEGTILADDTIAYITFLKRNDEVKILETAEDICTILLGGYKAQIAKKYIRMADEKYEEWDGFTRSGTKAYADTDLKEVVKSYSLNDSVHVIDDFDGLYAILMEDGSEAYIPKKNVSEKKIVVYHPQPAATTEETPAPSSGGSSHSSGGGSSSGGSSPAPAPAPSSSEPEWTEPVM